jgi:hypothetical protein
MIGCRLHVLARSARAVPAEPVPGARLGRVPKQHVIIGAVTLWHQRLP